MQSCCGLASQIKQGGSSLISWFVGQLGGECAEIKKENQQQVGFLFLS